MSDIWKEYELWVNSQESKYRHLIHDIRGHSFALTIKNNWNDNSTIIQLECNSCGKKQIRADDISSELANKMRTLKPNS